MRTIDASSLSRTSTEKNLALRFKGSRMPPGGVHLAAGLAISRFVLPWLPGVVPLCFSSAFRAALIFGSISPDLDLFPAAVAVAATWDKTWVDVVRRSTSRSTRTQEHTCLGISAQMRSSILKKRCSTVRSDLLSICIPAQFHRTFSHSVIVQIAIAALFLVAGRRSSQCPNDDGAPPEPEPISCAPASLRVARAVNLSKEVEEGKTEQLRFSPPQLTAYSTMTS